MKLVIIESPYAGNVERNLAYVRACMKDCLSHGEAPFASHALYTQPGVLDDADPAQRKLGIDAGFEWRKHAAATALYVDLGSSRGMQLGLEAAEAERKRRAAGYTPPFDHEIEFRHLPDALLAQVLYPFRDDFKAWPRETQDRFHAVWAAQVLSR